MATGSKPLPEMSAISSSPDDPVIRILLVGRNGSGKSSSGNTILGERKFKVHKQKKKHEAEVLEEVTQIGGKQVHVIDCPDLLNPDLSEEKLEEINKQLVSRCPGSLSSVLLTVPLEEPVQNEEEVMDYIRHLFGPEIQNYIMILFTHEDELDELDEPQTIDEYLQNHADLQQLVTECGRKFHCFNNKSKTDDQIQELLQKIERMMEENRGKLITDEMKRSESKDVLFDFSGGSSTDEVSQEIQIPERKDEIRLVLLGKTGTGKSATGNTILGKNVFESFISANSQTKKCSTKTVLRMGKKISVIDTPGLYDTELDEKEVISEIVKCITYASPGPHVFLIVIQAGRFTEEEKNTVEKLKKAFGEQMEKYTMFIFTHKDQLEKDNKTIEKFLQESQNLETLIQHCGNRFVCLDNNSASFPQFRDLQRNIEMMVADNRGTYFTNDMFNETEKQIQKIQMKKLIKKVKQYKQEHKEVTQTEWEKIYWKLAEESRREAENDFISVLKTSVFQIVMKLIPLSKEKASAIEEAKRKGFSHWEAVQLAVKATDKLKEGSMCVIQ